MTKRSSFAEMEEADRMLFIAQLCHYMWYDEDYFSKIKMVFESFENENVPKPMFFPK